ncbi:glycosyltransferase [Paenarthrobacter sp. DKR-5]|uniref:glycosyltransferase family 2 protein n=1 Tax=Paenarthrobacter sp. DKR-5 TaxID=2835535 RepID=UPI001BDCA143|nr:glycosyltransferase family 2 protein [Paenarthrobacter sp. DKR-5]MBT1004436.1 glycosyltransferase [Paenarthrobacter sp. DKR-5]
MGLETAAPASGRVGVLRRQAVTRAAALVTAVLGLNYIIWRWFASVNWDAWWIAAPLVLAETYSLVDSLLFGLTVWRYKERPAPADPERGSTVDVFITTYNEPLELVLRTARAAKAIDYPHQTWILDDGNRPDVRAAAESEGIGWISRSEDWSGMPRHAKAGNLNNALLATDGEFILVLDADQVPDRRILDRTLGYFRDDAVALVQTPQVFVNVPEADPLGSQAPLFYGPIQQGKDGWNAAFFCGSNAVIRREALMQLGVTRYVTETEVALHKALRTAGRVIAKARRNLGPDQARLAGALEDLAADVAQVKHELRRGESIGEVTYRFQERVAAVSRGLVSADMAALHAELASIEGLAEAAGVDGGSSLAAVDDAALDRLSQRDWSPLGAIETVRVLIGSVNADRGAEAQAVMPMATISVTEDMATCMRLHGLGWRTVYHHEQLADGLAPEDLQSALTQRLRWAQGTMQVFFRENPLVQKGLSMAQRLMYLATMWSYLSGFAAVVYLAAPVIYLTLGILPVRSLSTEFFVRLVPFLLVNQLMFYVVGRGVRTWRGQQYSLALFPTWIRAVTSAFGNVVFGRSLDFAVTPKTLQAGGGRPWHLVKPQLAAMAVLVFAVLAGAARLLAGAGDLLGTAVNVVWVAFDLLIFSVIIHAVRYPGFAAWSQSKKARSKPKEGTL